MLVPMSKYPKLEVLSLFKCKKLSDSDIAYLSLAGCFGFKQLRVLDIRFTGTINLKKSKFIFIFNFICRPRRSNPKNVL